MPIPPGTRGDADRDLSAALVLLNQLRPALAQGDRVQQNRIVAELIALHAPLGDQWERLADLALNNGEIGLARRAIDLFVEASGGAAGAIYRKASLLEQAGALREAFDLIGSLPANLLDPFALAYGRGTAALFLRESEEARAQLERAVLLQPQAGAAWLSLAMSGNLASDPELADRILSAERGIDDAPAPQRAAYFYAQGKVYAERGEHRQAFIAFARGASEVKRLKPYDRAWDRGEAEESLRGYDAENLAKIGAAQREPTGRSIFVTGLPRSGTTLVEQILVSHSAVGAGGEIDRLRLLANEIRGISWPALSTYVGTHGVAGIARFWNHLVDERLPGQGQIVDKTLGTTRLLGLAAALLPEAPLIWVVRDPLDCAWSCFRTFFPVNLQWTYDLDDIACHFRLQDELLRHWQDILGDRLLVVRYENLVDDPGEWIRRILAHCGLPEEPQVFTPHKTERVVTTASTMQVRRPINRDGIGAARPYREFLQPFIDAYSK
ncbi:MAG: sulfotransferase [Candidatus Andeanibacterium colombiense]|uniref:Sulfotransferase n=1 Tax=Candidatus Andeanibacterium colombiense TaxID=3121345 RepID=A0AAJ5X6W4_9SPHN|nr:MAG: sulfotransferase [Sphingomonadaceae bacterium]